MLKKIFFLLLLSAPILVAAPGQEMQSSASTALSTRQKTFVYVFATAASASLAAQGGKQVVACLPEKTPLVIKAGVFIPTALALLAGAYYNFQASDILGFCSRHRWLLLGL